MNNLYNCKCCLIKDEDYGWQCEECGKRYILTQEANEDDENGDPLHECRMWKDKNDETWQCEDPNCDLVLFFKPRK